MVRTAHEKRSEAESRGAAEMSRLRELKAKLQAERKAVEEERDRCEGEEMLLYSCGGNGQGLLTLLRYIVVTFLKIENQFTTWPLHS